MKYLFSIILTILLVSTSTASEPRNDAALKGLTESKVIFDINQGAPKRLLLRLEFVEKTYEQLKSFGTTPKFVLAFRGKASRYMTAGEDYILPENLATKKKIEERIQRFSTQGMALEQCALAAALQRIDNDEFLPEITVVANGYISMIGYQNQGYAFVPMD